MKRLDETTLGFLIAGGWKAASLALALRSAGRHFPPFATLATGGLAILPFLIRFSGVI
jgi:hypothetical protein